MSPNTTPSSDGGKARDAARVFVILWATCLVLHVGERAHAVMVSTWMADESAWHFFGLLLDRDLAFHWERAVAIGFYRGGVWALAGLGIHDFELWRIAYGTMLYAAWPLSLAACWALARDRDPYLLVFPALGYALGSANVGLFSASESHFMHAVFWVAAIGTVVNPRETRARLVVLVSLLCLAGSYAGAWILGLAIGAKLVSDWRGGAARDGHARLFLAGVGVVVMAGLVATTLKPGGLPLALAGLVLSLTGDPANVNLQLSLVAGALVVLAVLRGETRSRPRVVWAVAAVGVSMGTYHVAIPHDFHPDVYGYFARATNTLVPLALFGLLILYGRMERVRSTIQALAPALLALWVGQTAYLLSASVEFQSYLDAMTRITRGQRGVMLVPSPGFMQKVQPHPETWGRAPNLDQFATMWIAAPAHALLYSEGDIAVVLVPVAPGGEVKLGEYRELFLPGGQEKLARFGLRVIADPGNQLPYAPGTDGP